ncbi:MAG: hypothetical protein SO408_06875, partial [Sodaliphilus sp.]|nr:hypothetical protein [Sodaliphilus sp.]
MILHVRPSLWYHIEYQLFGADAKYRVPTMQNRWEIPLFPKAVFYVFVFDYIHDSATMHNLCPGIFHRIETWRRHIPTFCSCFLEGLPEV